ncbi:hypothetical protein ACHAXT_005763 [Thalassiosira profunda]
MSFEERSLEEREAASIVAGLSSATRNIDVAVDVVEPAGAKRSRDDDAEKKKPARKKKAAAKKPRKEPPMDATGRIFAAELRPPPWYYYTDHSLEPDDDPLVPMTSAGSVPTFPAKMHAILTNPALADVVEWAPHGRSWRIIKPREFEVRVLPKYFEHSKFSSFVRQANGWGFRRMGQGYEKNAYYHEYFLRSMPYLCKKMRRPKVSEKRPIDPEFEPDFDAISFQFPVPNEPPTRELLVIQKVMEVGAKARMPVMWDIETPPPSSPLRLPAVLSQGNLLEVGQLPALSHSNSYGDLKPAALANPPAQEASIPAPPVATAPPAPQENVGMGAYAQSYSQPPSAPVAAAASVQPADANFAAGFVAATAYHSNQMRDQMRDMLTNAFGAGVPPAAPPAAPTAAEINNAVNLLQRAGMGHAVNQGSNLAPQGAPGMAAAAAPSQPAPTSFAAQFAAFQAARSDPPPPYPYR